MADIYLLDGSTILYRSFYAIPHLATSTGQPTNAIYGFTNVLLKIIKDRRPKYMGIAFDTKGPTFRHKEFPEYKITRKPMPDDLSSQLHIVRQIIESLGIKIIEMRGYEADDVIATLATKLSSKGHKVYIITSDKDFSQLLSENIEIINPADYEIRNVKWFKEKYDGLEPEKMVDIIALSGDVSDNVPGISGIGEKTAVKLLKKFDNLEKIFENIEKVSPSKLREKLLKEKDKAFLSKKLACLDKNLPFDFEISELEIKKIDLERLMEIFTNLEFRRLQNYLYEIFPETKNLTINEDLIAFSNGETYKFEEIKENIDKFQNILADEKIEKYGFNLKEKIVQLKMKNVELKGNLFDIAIARYVTGHNIFKKDIFSMVEEYRRILKENNQEYLFYKVEMPLTEVLAWMEINGIRVDVEYLKNLSRQLSGEIKILEDKIYKEAGEVFNINSHQQLSKILFEKMKLPPVKKTKTGFSTENSVLEELSKLHPLPKLILQYRELHKLKSTYVDGLLSYVNKETGKIHPTFNQIITATGRLSCSNPNLQNIPIRTEKGSMIRKAFCPSDNNIFYSFDYSQIDLRILAHLSEDEKLMEAFFNDKDIHTETAQIIFPPDSLFSSGYTDKEKRRIAKTINFGIIYGMSPYGLSKELNITPEEAKVFINSYFEKFKGVKKYIEKIIKEAEKNGYVSTILGRRRYIPELKSEDKNQREFGKRVAINMPVQGSAADMIKVAMNNIYEYFRKRKLKSKLVLQIHDELLFDVYPEEEEEIRENVKKLMENAIKLKVPVKVEVKKGPNYLELS